MISTSSNEDYQVIKYHHFNSFGQSLGSREEEQNKRWEDEKKDR
jgi:hypothetical protein